MKLFKYDNYKIVISEEAFALAPFRRIWERDKSKTKDRAIQELGYIYFLCDPRSDYQYIVDLESRAAEIKEGEGLPEKWEPDEVVNNAIELYKKLVQTTTSLALEDIRISLEKVRVFIRNLNLNDVEDPIKASKEILAMGKLIPDYVKKVVETEKLVNKEIEEASRMRGGNQNNKLFEEGINI